MDMHKIPTIDFRKIEELKAGGSISEEWISLRDKVYKALEEYGCFEALLDGIPIEKLYEKLIEIFNMPLETKFRNSLSKSGYTSTNPNLSLQERLTIYDVLNPGIIDSFFNNIWPDGNPEICDMVHCYAKRLSEFDKTVRKMIFEKLGVEKYLDEHMKSTSNALGLFKYRVPKTEEEKIGLRPHTDKLIATVLSEYQGVNGLQVKLKNGEWIDVKYSSPLSFIFILNDSLSALTNGRLRAPYHRVVLENKERYSIGFSVSPTEGYIIKVPEELVDEDHPLLYKPYEALKYFEFSLTTAGCTLESFCGV